jgi:hypothetical protein
LALVSFSCTGGRKLKENGTAEEEDCAMDDSVRRVAILIPCKIWSERVTFALALGFMFIEWEKPPPWLTGYVTMVIHGSRHVYNEW